MHGLAIAVFWVSCGLVLYTYLAYPILIGLLARAFGHSAPPPHLSEADLPPISLLIAAYNEANDIAHTLRCALALDYPAEKREIVVASDGSTDRTVAVARRCAPDAVRVLDYPERRGKAAVLNASIPQLSGVIVLFCDANTEIDPQAARCLVRWFAAPAVGVVCGRLVLTDPRSGRNADSLYWKLETCLKRSEAALGALLGANGALYAIRRPLYPPVPEGTILDDFVIPLLAKLRTGCTIAYDPEAIAHEETPARVRMEFRRRARIGAGAFQALALLGSLLDPRRGYVALALLSHKVLRWLCPFFLIATFASGIVLRHEPVYRALLFLQAAFYALSGLVAALPPRARIGKPLLLPTMFTTMNAALLVGFWRWLRGTQGGAWERTTRAPFPRTR